MGGRLLMIGGKRTPQGWIEVFCKHRMNRLLHFDCKAQTVCRMFLESRYNQI
jgi:hypothetical protein